MAYEKNRRRPPREDDGTLIEGRNAVLETLRAGRTVDKVFVAEGARIGDVAAEARRHGVPVVTCDRRKLDHMSPTGNHQGVIAQAAAQEYVSLDDIFRVARERGERVRHAGRESLEVGRVDAQTSRVAASSRTRRRLRGALPLCRPLPGDAHPVHERLERVDLAVHDTARRALRDDQAEPRGLLGERRRIGRRGQTLAHGEPGGV